MKTRALAPGPAFTLVELLASVSLIAYLLVILFSATDAASHAWRDGQARTDAFQNGRTTLEILAREITPAVVDTRMQFVIAPGTVLAEAGARQVAPQAPALLWMAPLGDDGGLRCAGYFLQRDAERKFYRLKRLLAGPRDASGHLSRFFPRVTSAQDPANPRKLIDPRDALARTSPTDAKWFTRTWTATAFDDEAEHNEQAIVSTVADGVIALWVQSYDLCERPIPLVSQARQHPKSDLFFNSAAYFQFATTTPFESGKSVLYLAETPQTMKANRLPQALEITIVTLDHNALQKAVAVPEQTNELDAEGALDVEASRKLFQENLQASRIYSARTFTTRTRLLNGN